ncbi:Na+/H+ antiporter subunit G [Rickettsia endosymbiont of Halotydeus destructor]|uniref:Na+/H+ antiporter subunit G n=1 Tax=Rickettsia endosymbiont of Halotydeus destructor TaxID=2996754 RepID=UPI003BAF3DBF
MILYYMGASLIIFGLFAILSGIIGLFRLPDFYTKLHAASVIECAGVPLCLIGLACTQASLASSLKLILAAFLIFLLNPVSTHALGKASLLMKVRAYYTDKKND